MPTELERSAPPASLGDVIASYLRSLDQQGAPDRTSLLERYPEHADELRTFFVNHDAMESVARPLRSAGGEGTDGGETCVGEASDDAPSTPARDAAPTRFGDYELLEEIARGGMGVVYKARQVSLNRVVALKMILPDRLESSGDVERFYREAEAVAHLDHPHIVPVFDVGRHQGQHYFSMKLIEGGSLAQIISRKDAEGVENNPNSSLRSLRLCAQLLATVARAVHCAHQRGILHRDLKPANILLDGDGIPYVTDFGLAKRVSSSPSETEKEGELTRCGAILGTPSYMAPEQATADKGLSTAADVYSLGAILYELLTGQPPFKGDTPLDTLVKVVAEEPPRPRSLNPQVNRDLETVCLKCLEKDPSKRYDSAAAVADDLERWLAHEPIRARRAGVWERAVKWARRSPAVAALTAAVVLTAAVGFAVIVWQLNQTEAARMLAEEERDEKEKARKTASDEAGAAERARLLAVDERDEKEKARKEEAAARARAETALEKAEQALYLARVTQANSEWTASNVVRAEELLDRCRPQDRRWEWHFLKRLCHQEVYSLDAGRGKSVTVACSPDGKTLATASETAVFLWQGDSGKPDAVLPFANPTPIASLAFNREGDLLAAASGPKLGDPDGPRKAIVWDVRAKKALYEVEGHSAVAFSPDGKTLAAGAVAGGRATGAVRLWDARTGERPRDLIGHTGFISGLVFSPDGKKLVSLSKDQTLRTWDLASQREESRIAAEVPNRQQVAVSPDGKLIALAGKGSTVRLLEFGTGKEEAVCRGHTDEILSVAFSRDGKKLATGSADTSARVWSVPSGELLMTLRGHHRPVGDLAFFPDGNRLATCGLRHAVNVWDLTTPKDALSVRRHPEKIETLAFSPDGKWLASVSESEVQVGPPNEMKVPYRRTFRQNIDSVAFLPGGSDLLLASGNGKVRRWEPQGRGATGRVTEVVDHESRIYCIALSRDGKRLATGGIKGETKVWEVGTGKLLHTLSKHDLAVRCIAFSPDGKRLATVERDVIRGGVALWDVETGKQLHRHAVNLAPQWVAFSGDGTRLAESNNKTIRLWDVAEGRVPGETPLLTLFGRARVSNSLSFSPDGRRLAAPGADRAVRLWDMVSGEELLTLRLHAEGVEHVAFSPDGELLATGGADGVVKVLDGRPWVAKP